jgi:hypothetical protein
MAHRPYRPYHSNAVMRCLKSDFRLVWFRARLPRRADYLSPAVTYLTGQTPLLNNPFRHMPMSSDVVRGPR